MMTQAKYYRPFLKPANTFAQEINEKIKNINLEDKSYEKIIFIDENNCEWTLSKDYSLGILEITVHCKMMVNNKPRYKSAWVYDKVNTGYDTYHLIKINNLYFHIDKSKNLLL